MVINQNSFNNSNWSVNCVSLPEGEGAWISCWITLLTLAVTGGHVNNPRAVKKILALLQIMDKHSGLEGAWWEVYTEKQAFIHHEFNTTAKPSGILWSQSIMNLTLYSKAIWNTLWSQSIMNLTLHQSHLDYSQISEELLLC